MKLLQQLTQQLVAAVVVAEGSKSNPTSQRRNLHRALLDLLSTLRTSTKAQIVDDEPALQQALLKQVLASSQPLFSKPICELFAEVLITLFTQAELTSAGSSSKVAAAVEALLTKAKDASGATPSSTRTTAIFTLGELMGVCFRPAASALFDTTQALLRLASFREEGDNAVRAASTAAVIRLLSAYGTMGARIITPVARHLQLVTVNDPAHTVRLSLGAGVQTLAAVSCGFTLVSFDALIALALKGICDPHPGVRMSAALGVSSVLATGVVASRIGMLAAETAAVAMRAKALRGGGGMGGAGKGGDADGDGDSSSDDGGGGDEDAAPVDAAGLDAIDEGPGGGGGGDDDDGAAGGGDFGEGETPADSANDKKKGKKPPAKSAKKDAKKKEAAKKKKKSSGGSKSGRGIFSRLQLKGGFSGALARIGSRMIAGGGSSMALSAAERAAAAERTATVWHASGGNVGMGASLNLTLPHALAYYCNLLRNAGRFAHKAGIKVADVRLCVAASAANMLATLRTGPGGIPDCDVPVIISTVLGTTLFVDSADDNGDDPASAADDGHKAASSSSSSASTSPLYLASVSGAVPSNGPHAMHLCRCTFHILHFGLMMAPPSFAPEPSYRPDAFRAWQQRVLGHLVGYLKAQLNPSGTVLEKASSLPKTQKLLALFLEAKGSAELEQEDAKEDKEHEEEDRLLDEEDKAVALAAEAKRLEEEEEAGANEDDGSSPASTSSAPSSSSLPPARAAAPSTGGGGGLSGLMSKFTFGRGSAAATTGGTAAVKGGSGAIAAPASSSAATPASSLPRKATSSTLSSAALGAAKVAASKTKERQAKEKARSEATLASLQDLASVSTSTVPSCQHHAVAVALELASDLLSSLAASASTVSKQQHAQQGQQGQQGQHSATFAVEAPEIAHFASALFPFARSCLEQQSNALRRTGVECVATLVKLCPQFSAELVSSLLVAMERDHSFLTATARALDIRQLVAARAAASSMVDAGRILPSSSSSSSASSMSFEADGSAASGAGPKKAGSSSVSFAQKLASGMGIARTTSSSAAVNAGGSAAAGPAAAQRRGSATSGTMKASGDAGSAESSYLLSPVMTHLGASPLHASAGGLGVPGSGPGSGVGVVVDASVRAALVRLNGFSHALATVTASASAEPLLPGLLPRCLRLSQKMTTRRPYLPSRYRAFVRGLASQEEGADTAAGDEAIRKRASRNKIASLLQAASSSGFSIGAGVASSSSSSSALLPALAASASSAAMAEVDAGCARAGFCLLQGVVAASSSAVLRGDANEPWLLRKETWSSLYRCIATELCFYRHEQEGSGIGVAREGSGAFALCAFGLPLPVFTASTLLSSSSTAATTVTAAPAGSLLPSSSAGGGAADTLLGFESAIPPALSGLILGSTSTSAGGAGSPGSSADLLRARALYTGVSGAWRASVAAAAANALATLATAFAPLSHRFPNACRDVYGLTRVCLTLVTAVPVIPLAMQELLSGASAAGRGGSTARKGGATRAGLVAAMTAASSKVQSSRDVLEAASIATSRRLASGAAITAGSRAVGRDGFPLPLASALQTSAASAFSAAVTPGGASAAAGTDGASAADHVALEGAAGAEASSGSSAASGSALRPYTLGDAQFATPQGVSLAAISVTRRAYCSMFAAAMQAVATLPIHAPVGSAFGFVGPIRAQALSAAVSALTGATITIEPLELGLIALDEAVAAQQPPAKTVSSTTVASADRLRDHVSRFCSKELSEVAISPLSFWSPLSFILSHSAVPLVSANIVSSAAGSFLPASAHDSAEEEGESSSDVVALSFANSLPSLVPPSLRSLAVPSFIAPLDADLGSLAAFGSGFASTSPAIAVIERVLRATAAEVLSATTLSAAEGLAQTLAGDVEAAEAVVAPNSESSRLLASAKRLLGLLSRLATAEEEQELLALRARMAESLKRLRGQVTVLFSTVSTAAPETRAANASVSILCALVPSLAARQTDLLVNAFATVFRSFSFSQAPFKSGVEKGSGSLFSPTSKATRAEFELEDEESRNPGTTTGYRLALSCATEADRLCIARNVSGAVLTLLSSLTVEQTSVAVGSGGHSAPAVVSWLLSLRNVLANGISSADAQTRSRCAASLGHLVRLAGPAVGKKIAHALVKQLRPVEEQPASSSFLGAVASAGALQALACIKVLAMAAAAASSSFVDPSPASLSSLSAPIPDSIFVELGREIRFPIRGIALQAWVAVSHGTAVRAKAVRRQWLACRAKALDLARRLRKALQGGDSQAAIVLAGKNGEVATAQSLAAELLTALKEAAGLQALLFVSALPQEGGSSAPESLAQSLKRQVTTSLSLLEAHAFSGSSSAFDCRSQLSNAAYGRSCLSGAAGGVYPNEGEGTALVPVNTASGASSPGGAPGAAKAALPALPEPLLFARSSSCATFHFGLGGSSGASTGASTSSSNIAAADGNGTAGGKLSAARVDPAFEVPGLVITAFDPLVAEKPGAPLGRMTSSVSDPASLIAGSSATPLFDGYMPGNGAVVVLPPAATSIAAAVVSGAPAAAAASGSTVLAQALSQQFNSLVSPFNVKGASGCHPAVLAAAAIAGGVPLASALASSSGAKGSKLTPLQPGSGGAPAGAPLALSVSDALAFGAVGPASACAGNGAASSGSAAANQPLHPAIAAAASLGLRVGVPAAVLLPVVDLATGDVIPPPAALKALLAASLQHRQQQQHLHAIAQQQGAGWHDRINALASHAATVAGLPALVPSSSSSSSASAALSLPDAGAKATTTGSEVTASIASSDNDDALFEAALQGAGGADDSAAAKAGRGAGADDSFDPFALACKAHPSMNPLAAAIAGGGHPALPSFDACVFGIRGIDGGVGSTSGSAAGGSVLPSTASFMVPSAVATLSSTEAAGGQGSSGAAASSTVADAVSAAMTAAVATAETDSFGFAHATAPIVPPPQLLMAVKEATADAIMAADAAGTVASATGGCTTVSGSPVPVHRCNLPSYWPSYSSLQGASAADSAAASVIASYRLSARAAAGAGGPAAARATAAAISSLLEQPKGSVDTSGPLADEEPVNTSPFCLPGMKVGGHASDEDAALLALASLQDPSLSLVDVEGFQKPLLQMHLNVCAALQLLRRLHEDRSEAISFRDQEVLELVSALETAGSSEIAAGLRALLGQGQPEPPHCFYDNEDLYGLLKRLSQLWVSLASPSAHSASGAASLNPELGLLVTESAAALFELSAGLPGADHETVFRRASLPQHATTSAAPAAPAAAPLLTDLSASGLSGDLFSSAPVPLATSTLAGKRSPFAAFLLPFYAALLTGVNAGGGFPSLSEAALAPSALALQALPPQLPPGFTAGGSAAGAGVSGGGAKAKAAAAQAAAAALATMQGQSVREFPFPLAVAGAVDGSSIVPANPLPSLMAYFHATDQIRGASADGDSEDALWAARGRMSAGLWLLALERIGFRFLAPPVLPKGLLHQVKMLHTKRQQAEDKKKAEQEEKEAKRQEEILAKHKKEEQERAAAAAAKSAAAAASAAEEDDILGLFAPVSDTAMVAATASDTSLVPFDAVAPAQSFSGVSSSHALQAIAAFLPSLADMASIVSSVASSVASGSLSASPAFPGHHILGQLLSGLVPCVLSQPALGTFSPEAAGIGLFASPQAYAATWAAALPSATSFFYGTATADDDKALVQALGAEKTSHTALVAAMAQSFAAAGIGSLSAPFAPPASSLTAASFSSLSLCLDLSAVPPPPGSKGGKPKEDGSWLSVVVIARTAKGARPSAAAVLAASRCGPQSGPGKQMRRIRQRRIKEAAAMLALESEKLSAAASKAAGASLSSHGAMGSAWRLLPSPLASPPPALLLDDARSSQPPSALALSTDSNDRASALMLELSGRGGFVAGWLHLISSVAASPDSGISGLEGTLAAFARKELSRVVTLPLRLRPCLEAFAGLVDVLHAAVSSQSASASGIAGAGLAVASSTAVGQEGAKLEGVSGSTASFLWRARQRAVRKLQRLRRAIEKRAEAAQAGGDFGPGGAGGGAGNNDDDEEQEGQGGDNTKKEDEELAALEAQDHQDSLLEQRFLSGELTDESLANLLVGEGGEENGLDAASRTALSSFCQQLVGQGERGSSVFSSLQGTLLAPYSQDLQAAGAGGIFRSNAGAPAGAGADDGDGGSNAKVLEASAAAFEGEIDPELLGQLIPVAPKGDSLSSSSAFLLSLPLSADSQGGLFYRLSAGLVDASSDGSSSALVAGLDSHALALASLRQVLGRPYGCSAIRLLSASVICWRHLRAKAANKDGAPTTPLPQSQARHVVSMLKTLASSVALHGSHIVAATAKLPQGCRLVLFPDEETSSLPLATLGLLVEIFKALVVEPHPESPTRTLVDENAASAVLEALTPLASSSHCLPESYATATLTGLSTLLSSSLSLSPKVVVGIVKALVAIAASASSVASSSKAAVLLAKLFVACLSASGALPAAQSSEAPESDANGAPSKLDIRKLLSFANLLGPAKGTTYQQDGENTAFQQDDDLKRLQQATAKDINLRLAVLAALANGLAGSGGGLLSLWMNKAANSSSPADAKAACSTAVVKAALLSLGNSNPDVVPLLRFALVDSQTWSSLAGTASSAAAAAAAAVAAGAAAGVRAKAQQAAADAAQALRDGAKLFAGPLLQGLLLDQAESTPASEALKSAALASSSAFSRLSTDTLVRFSQHLQGSAQAALLNLVLPNQGASCSSLLAGAIASALDEASPAPTSLEHLQSLASSLLLANSCDRTTQQLARFILCVLASAHLIPFLPAEQSLTVNPLASVFKLAPTELPQELRHLDGAELAKRLSDAVTGPSSALPGEHLNCSPVAAAAAICSLLRAQGSYDETSVAEVISQAFLSLTCAGLSAKAASDDVRFATNCIWQTVNGLQSRVATVARENCFDTLKRLAIACAAADDANNANDPQLVSRVPAVDDLSGALARLDTLEVVLRRFLLPGALGARATAAINKTLAATSNQQQLETALQTESSAIASAALVELLSSLASKELPDLAPHLTAGASDEEKSKGLLRALARVHLALSARSQLLDLLSPVVKAGFVASLQKPFAVLAKATLCHLPRGRWYQVDDKGAEASLLIDRSVKAKLNALAVTALKAHLLSFTLESAAQDGTSEEDKQDVFAGAFFAIVPFLNRSRFTYCAVASEAKKTAGSGPVFMPPFESRWCDPLTVCRVAGQLCLHLGQAHPAPFKGLLSTVLPTPDARTFVQSSMRAALSLPATAEAVAALPLDEALLNPPLPTSQASTLAEVEEKKAAQRFTAYEHCPGLPVSADILGPLLANALVAAANGSLSPATEGMRAFLPSSLAGNTIAAPLSSPTAAAPVVTVPIVSSSASVVGVPKAAATSAAAPTPAPAASGGLLLKKPGGLGLDLSKFKAAAAPLPVPAPAAAAASSSASNGPGSLLAAFLAKQQKGGDGSDDDGDEEDDDALGVRAKSSVEDDEGKGEDDDEEEPDFLAAEAEAAKKSAASRKKTGSEDEDDDDGFAAFES